MAISKNFWYNCIQFRCISAPWYPCNLQGSPTHPEGFRLELRALRLLIMLLLGFYNSPLLCKRGLVHGSVPLSHERVRFYSLSAYLPQTGEDLGKWLLDNVGIQTVETAFCSKVRCRLTLSRYECIN